MCGGEGRAEWEEEERRVRRRRTLKELDGQDVKTRGRARKDISRLWEPLWG